MKRSFLLWGILCTGFSVAMAEIPFQKNPNTKSFPLLRGTISFEISHPLRVIQGSLQEMGGFFLVNEENLRAGVQFYLEGQTAKTVFNEPLAKFLTPWVGDGQKWTAFSSVMIPIDVEEQGGIKMEHIVNFEIGGVRSVQRLVQKCTLDDQLVKCKFEHRNQLHRLGIATPMIWKIPSLEIVSAKGELVFGEKTAR